MPVLVVMIDDEPWQSGVTKKIEEIRGILHDPEFLLLVPKVVEQAILDSYDGTAVQIRCYDPPLGHVATVEDFVDWCTQQMTPIMNRVAAVFCDWKLEISQKTRHWEYLHSADNNSNPKQKGLLQRLFGLRSGVDDLEGMKDLYRRLNQQNPQAQWVFLTNQPKKVNLIGFAIYDKAAKLVSDDVFAIRHAADEIAAWDWDIETYIAWLDRHEFELPEVPKNSLRHLSVNPKTWGKACSICESYFRPQSPTLQRAKKVLPSCVFVKTCASHDPSVWENYWREFILFMDPDWSIISALVRLFKTFSFSFELEMQSSRGVEYYQLKKIPDAINATCGADEAADVTYPIHLDTTIRMLNGDRGPRHLINSAGRHYGRGNKQYACVLPDVAADIARVLYQNLTNPLYDNRCMTVSSRVDTITSRFVVVFDHLCGYRNEEFGGVLKGLEPLKGDKFDYSACYDKVNVKCQSPCVTKQCDELLCTFKCELYFPLLTFGAPDMSPWGGGTP